MTDELEDTVLALSELTTRRSVLVVIGEPKFDYDQFLRDYAEARRHVHGVEVVAMNPRIAPHFAPKLLNVAADVEPIEFSEAELKSFGKLATKADRRYIGRKIRQLRKKLKKLA